MVEFRSEPSQPDSHESGWSTNGSGLEVFPLLESSSGGVPAAATSDGKTVPSQTSLSRPAASAGRSSAVNKLNTSSSGGSSSGGSTGQGGGHHKQRNKRPKKMSGGGGYVPASAVESDYHNPYDHHQRFAGLEALGASTANTSEDGGNHYEAPSCLVRNPSGSLFIPSTGEIG